MLTTDSPSNHQFYNIGLNLVNTGTLKAAVVNATTVYLNYEIIGNQTSFSVHNTQIWPLPDATFNGTFDIELLLQLNIPATVGPLSYH